MRNNVKILVVDDIVENLEIFTDVLSAADYDVAAVTSGRRALKRLQTYIPDLILLDVKMPDIDGFEVCRQIKSNELTANIPIIFIAAFSKPENIEKGFSVGAVDYIHKPIQELELLSRVKNHLELQRLRQSLEQQVVERTYDLEVAMAQLQEALTQLQETQLRMLQSEKMATHDPLTELPNRRLLMERLETSLAISQHSHQAIALIFLDLDGFKQVNDTYDHQAGDDLLVEVTQRLQACLRKRDGLFRLGGDEFVILIDQVESTVAMIELAKRLLANLQRPFRIKGHTVTIGGSFGIKVYDGQAEQTVREVLSDADQAMYKAKSRRNCVVLHGEAVFHGVD